MNEESGYRSYWGSVSVNPNYRPTREIIRDRKTLAGVVKKYSVLAFDIETTGLNPLKSELVGFSISGEENVGFYIPIAHKTGENAEENIFDIFMRGIKKLEIKLLVFNEKFDILFEREKGKDFDDIEIQDIMLALFLMDSNVAMPSLKYGVKHYCGIKMKMFSDLVGEGGDISLLSPEEVLDYTTDDAICLLRLAKKIVPVMQKECSAILKIDNKFVKHLISIMMVPIHIDLEWVTQLKEILDDELKRVEREVYGVIGVKINLKSTKQKSEAFKMLGLSTGVKTKADDFSMNAYELEKVDHPLARLFIEHNMLEKCRNSYIMPLLNNKYGEWGRVNYNMTVTASGRLSSSGDRKNDYFMRLNMQNLIKPESKDYYVYPDGDFLEYRIEDKKEEGCVGMIEGKDMYLNIRNSFIPDTEDYYVVSVDYKSEELVILANMSKEPKWIETFKKKGDLHRRTAVALWGEDSYNSDTRKKGKTTNFMVIYGATPGAVAYKQKIPIEEARFIVDGFLGEYRTLHGWTNRIKRETKKRGVSYTYFKRPRRMKYYYSGKDRKLEGYAGRVAVNNPVQGSGADIFKIAVIRLFENTFKKYTLDLVRPFALIHDEIAFLIRKDVLHEACLSIRKDMEFPIKGWEIQLETEFEIGKSLGSLFPMLLDREGVSLDFKKEVV